MKKFKTPALISAYIIGGFSLTQLLMWLLSQPSDLAFTIAVVIIIFVVYFGVKQLIKQFKQ